MQGWARSILMIGILAAGGCRDDSSSTAAPVEAVELAASFDAESAGIIQGRVTWRGDLPDIPPFRVRPYLDYSNAARLHGEYPNPHAPEIDPASRGVAGVAVMLRTVEPAESKRWSHAPVRVETDAKGLTVFQ